MSRALRLADNATVVVKQASADTVAAEALRRIQHEHDILDALRGEGVVEVHEIVRDGKHVALVIENFGTALATWIAERRFSLAEALDVGIAVARGLVRIHAADVVHRDINPNNIVYDPATRVAKIIDFELASRPGSRLAGAINPSVIEGTLHYMAPEQTGRLTRVVDGRADLYSLGITLYELLTRRRPFDGVDALELVHAHLAEQPPRVDANDPAIPSVIADIVMKLIAKAPDQRYQTATGLLADLERCRRALDADGRIAPFAIGHDDISARFELPDRLYGRDAEVRALLDAVARTARGAVETVLVTGYSGIGKSSVVREIAAQVIEHRGCFASGKFDQLNRDVPYSAVVAALGELVAQILAAPAIDGWRTAIVEAIGDAAPLVRSVLPAIERVLGPQPPLPALDAETMRRRLASGLAGLVQMFARTQPPLVLFLDDMQWADAASLQLLTQLVSSERTAALLIIEAFRDSEVAPAHPFALTLREHERRGATLSRIALAPLDLAATTELVADTARRSPEDVAGAAALIWRKTDGNPFFIRQFLRMLHDDGYLTFDPGANAFGFDMAEIERAAITDNVAELLAHELGKLTAATRETLVTAAAIGTEFDVAALALLAGITPAAVHASLGPALDADLIHQRAAPSSLSERYRFRHDRIQQAAYEAAPAAARERLHLSIARHLLASSSPDELEARLFEIVHHLNCSIARIDDAGERARFAELALHAGQRARRAGAFDVAATMLRSACRLRQRSDPGWFAAHLALAEALTLGGSHDEARAVVRATREHAAPRDRASLDALDTTICLSMGLMSEALACGRRATALLGVELPSDPALLGQEIAADIAVIMATLAEGPIEAWIDRPEMRDPDKLAAMSAMLSCIPAAYQFEPQLLVLISTRLVALSLRHGNCGSSARGYATFAINMWMLGDHELALRFAQLGVDLVRRLDAATFEPAVDFQLAAFAAPWRLPIDEACERLRAMIPRALEIGDFAHAGYAAAFAVTYTLIRGAPLEEICEEARRYRILCVRLGLPELEIWLSWFPWHTRSWTGAPPAAGELDIDIAAVERTLTTATGSQSMIANWRVMELERLFWQGDFAGVVDKYPAFEPLLAALPANVHNAEVRFYHCLAAISIGANDPRVDASRAKLAGYARACPANFGHMSTLVEAELARARGDVATAIAHYDMAIDAAAESRFSKVEVIAHELAARFWLERKHPAFAAVHLGKARDVCEYWGALPRARALELRRRSLGATTGFHATMRSTTGVASTLDFATVVKASQAIASDVVLDSLLAKIMAIIIENTGAQAGSIILGGEDMLLVHASKLPGAAVAVSRGVELARADSASEGIVRYVLRTREPVALGDATRHPMFRSDPYVRTRRPRSVLCLPIVHQERVLGAVYLENNLIADAFAVDRLDALGILVAQLAISIENAMMFSRLEQRVAERTHALTEANQQLREQAIVRERIESELRLAQKLQSVGQLAAGVAHEINTPMQYIGDSLAFISETLDALLGLVDTYHGAADPATRTIDLAVMRDAEAACDLAYLRENGPAACARACEGVARVSKIVLAMKAFSHPDQHDKTPAALNDALRNTLVVAQNAYRHVADLATDFGDLPPLVCHVGELNQVFLNLVVNAAHAIEDAVRDTDQRGTISVRTSVEDGDVVLVTISDTGTGIPESIRTCIFDPFFTTKEVGRGTGQGLALARTVIVDRHGGSISFETCAGAGTTFFVRIPMRGGGAAAPAITDASAPESRARSRAAMESIG